ncbi:MAG: GNAT family N-acetyltransferase [Acidobacteria bacterium]|nr:GNAT family N-acetyltransferase [Acidobacteriota bacterium]
MAGAIVSVASAEGRPDFPSLEPRRHLRVLVPRPAKRRGAQRVVLFALEVDDRQIAVVAALIFGDRADDHARRLFLSRSDTRSRQNGDAGKEEDQQ